MELNKIQSTGNWGKAADDLNQNFTKVNTAVEQIKNATTRNKGYFSSEEALNEAFPSANVGDIAYVGIGYPYAIWKWNGSAWANSGSTGGEESVNLGEFYNKEETDEKFTELGSKRLELSVSVFGNFNIDITGFPTITLTTEGRGVYIAHGDRTIDYKVMEAAELVKEVGSLDYQMWFVVYEPNQNIYNIYTLSERDNIPSDALTIAAFHGKKISYTLSNFKLNGYYIRVDNAEEFAAETKKAVEALGDMEFLVDVEDKMLFGLPNEGYINTSGSISGKTNAANTKVFVKGYRHLSVYTALNMYGYAIAFYDREDNLLKDISIIGGEDSTTSLKWYEVDLLNNKYKDVHYVILSCYGASSINKFKAVLKGEKKTKQTTEEKQLGFAKFQKPTFDINVILVYGQSLAAGQQTCPPLSTENYGGNLMIGNEWSRGTAFEPLVAKCPNYTQAEAESASKSDQELAESPGVNFVNAIKCAIDGHTMKSVDRNFLIVNAAVGGQSIELLSKSCPNNSGANYTSMLKKLKKAKDLADAENKSIGCCGVIWMQGEWNGRSYTNQGWTSGTNATSDKDSYKALLIGGIDNQSVTHNGLINDLDADIKSTFGQNISPVFLCSQTGIGTNLSFDMPIDMALLEASNESEKLYMVGSSYMVPNRGVHLDPNGSRWMGEHYAKAWCNIIIKGIEYLPLQPTEIYKNGNIISIHYNNTNPLSVDVNVLNKVENLGFVVRNNGESVGIKNIEVLESSVNLVTDSDLDGVVDLSYAGMDVEYGNICDSDKWLSFEKYKELPSQLKPTPEPKGDDGSYLYNKNYPMKRFSVKFYRKLI